MCLPAGYLGPSSNSRTVFTQPENTVLIVQPLYFLEASQKETSTGQWEQMLLVASAQPCVFAHHRANRGDKLRERCASLHARSRGPSHYSSFPTLQGFTQRLKVLFRKTSATPSLQTFLLLWSMKCKASQGFRYKLATPLSGLFLL